MSASTQNMHTFIHISRLFPWTASSMERSLASKDAGMTYFASPLRTGKSMSYISIARHAFSSQSPDHPET